MTVGDLLAAKNAPLEQADSVVPTADTPVTNGLTIQVTRDRTDTRVETQPIAPPENKVEDPELEKDKTVVENPGVPGERTATVEVKTVNGVEAGRTELSATVIKEPVAAVVKVGTKQASAPLCPTRRRGMPLLSARRPETGPSTPATVSTEDFSSPRALGSIRRWSVRSSRRPRIT